MRWRFGKRFALGIASKFQQECPEEAQGNFPQMKIERNTRLEAPQSGGGRIFRAETRGAGAKWKNRATRRVACFAANVCGRGEGRRKELCYTAFVPSLELPRRKTDQ